VLFRQTSNERGVERLGETRVGDRRRQPAAVEVLCRLETFGQPRSLSK